jgi:uncharacterized membrane protein
MTLETSKILGGIGAILLFIGIIPLLSYYGIIEIIGAILIIVGLYGIAGHFKEPTIFKNALIALIAGIVGIAVAGAIVLTVVLANLKTFITQLYPSWNGDWSTLQGMTPDTSAITDPNTILQALGPIFVDFIIVAVILWICAIIGAFFLRLSLKQVSVKSNVGLFGTAGLLLLIGAFLSIIVIGLVLMWIAALLLAIAFFQLKTEPTVVTTAPPPPPTPV